MRFGAIRTKPGSRLAFIMVPLKDRPRPKRAPVVIPPEPVVIPPEPTPKPVVIAEPKLKEDERFGSANWGDMYKRPYSGIAIGIPERKPAALPEPIPEPIPEPESEPEPEPESEENILANKFNKAYRVLKRAIGKYKANKKSSGTIGTIKNKIEYFIGKYSYEKYTDLGEKIEDRLREIQMIASKDFNIKVIKLLEAATDSDLGDPMLLIEEEEEVDKLLREINE